MAERDEHGKDFDRFSKELVAAGFSEQRALGGPFGGGLGTICQRCGALVMLGDPEQTDSGTYVERGVRLHSTWHAANDKRNDEETPDA